MVLERSRKLTPTLEQMAPGSRFIAALNAGTRPEATTYAVLAGDIDRYVATGDPPLAGLLVKAGRSAAFDALFAQGANDIAVGVGSIYAEAAGALAGASHADVACHHLNYFSAAAGQAALKAVEW